MDLLFKILWLFAAPIILIVAGLFGVAWLLNIDDLHRCTQRPDAPSEQCRSADAIVAISGGGTDARASEAIRLYQDGWGERLVFSGAAEDKAGISNAEAMQRQALAAGVPANVILLDENAADTAANAAGLRRIAKENQFDRLILVTSPYHQRRASIEFARALGPTVTIINHPTPEDRYWDTHYWWLSPYSWYLALTETGKLIYLTIGGR